MNDKTHLSQNGTPSSSHDEGERLALPPDADQPRTRRFFRRTSRVMAVVLLLGILAWPATMIVRSYWTGQTRSVYKAHLKQVLAAVLQYQQDYGKFPPAFTVSPEGRPLHSWRVLILPYLGKEELYNNLRLNEPFNSRHNRRFVAQRPEAYSNPWVGDRYPHVTHLMAIVGRQTVWPEKYSVQLSDIKDGQENTAMLVAYPDKIVNWMEPNDLPSRDWVGKVFGPLTPESTCRDGVQVGFVSGNVRFVSRAIDPTQLRSLISINAGSPLPGVEWPPLSVGESAPIVKVRPASEFSVSEISPVLDTKITGQSNVIYCATFQLAWDQFRQFSASATNPSSPLIAALNAAPFDSQNISPDSCVIWAGGASEFSKLRDHVHAKYGSYTHDWIPNTSGSSDNVVIYAALVKYLPFKINFDRWSAPLLFGSAADSHPVRSYGIEHPPEGDERSRQLINQVDILDHVSDDDFIIKLTTREKSDDIYLAKIPPQATLGATLQAAQARIKTPANNGFRRTIGQGDQLQIPALAFAVDREYQELEGVAGISVARQTILFRLDERGGILESEAIIIGEFGEEYDPQRARKLLFDGPFLLWLQESTATAPYFVAWIANREFMEPFAE